MKNHPTSCCYAERFCAGCYAQRGLEMEQSGLQRGESSLGVRAPAPHSLSRQLHLPVAHFVFHRCCLTV